MTDFSAPKTVIDFIKSIDTPEDWRVERAIETNDVGWLVCALRDTWACLDIRYFKFRELIEKIERFCDKNKIEIKDIIHVESLDQWNDYRSTGSSSEKDFKVRPVIRNKEELNL